MDLSDCSRLLYHWAIPPDIGNCLVSCKQLFSSRIEPARQNAQPTRLLATAKATESVATFFRNILSIKICCTKKARRDSWDLGRKMHSQTVMSRVIWFCEAVAKLFFLFLWRRQFQLDWTLFGRFDSTHFYGRDSSLSLIRTHTYYLLFYISAILSWLPCRHSIRPTTKNRLDRRVDTFFFGPTPYGGQMTSKENHLALRHKLGNLDIPSLTKLT